MELFNNGQKGLTELGKHPHLMELMLEMKRAQGLALTADQLMAEQPIPEEES